MTEAKQIFDPSLTAQIADTIGVMRQMRGAICERLADIYDTEESYLQVPLHDAEPLADAMANVVMAALFSPSFRQEQQQLQGLLRLHQRKYGRFRQVTSAGNSPKTAAENLTDKFVYFDAPSFPALFTNQIQKTNRLSNLTLADFSTPRMGVLSPLSTDYLTWKIYQKFMRERLHQESYQLKPMAVDEWLMLGVIPRNEQGVPLLSDCERLTVLVEFQMVGSTRRAASQLVRIAYPQKKVL